MDGLFRSGASSPVGRLRRPATALWSRRPPAIPSCASCPSWWKTFRDVDGAWRAPHCYELW